MSNSSDRLVGNPNLRHSIFAACGRFSVDDVIEVVASAEGSGPVGPEWHIVRLRPDRGAAFGGVWADFNYTKLNASSITTSNTILGAIRGLPTVRDEEPRKLRTSMCEDLEVATILWREVRDRTYDEFGWSPERAIGQLLERGILTVGNVPTDNRHVASLRVRLRDTFDLPWGSKPESEPIQVTDALDLLALHALDPVHGVHAWGVSARRAAPRWEVRDEMAEAGYDVDALIQGRSPVQALGLQ